MILIDHMFNPSVRRIEIQLTSEKDTLHESLFKLFLQCVSFIVTGDKHSESFRVSSVSQEAIYKVREAFRKLRLNFEICEVKEKFQAQADMLQCELSSHETVMPIICKKIRFYFLKESGSTSCGSSLKDPRPCT